MTGGSAFKPIVTVVGFHHARGPEIESWYGVEDGVDPALENDWSLLPFMALSDGAHATTEDFSYFTLRHAATSTHPAISLFGISCTRQMDAADLIDRPADVTRSTVQKGVVVIADSPQYFGQLREKLSMVTRAWFAQRDFTDTEILKQFQESLQRSLHDTDDDKDQYLGLSLRELIREFKWQTLVLFKCCLLQPKMLFFGSRCERLCMMQFSLISLIPGLIRNLEDCADPELANYEKQLVMPVSLRTSERASLLSYMGLPLQIFGKGSLFGPYTPLQQLDILADHDTKSYIVGSTNSLLLQQRDRYSDILINLDDHNLNITSPSLRHALALSVADRRWIDFLTQAVNDTWDESNPTRPKTLGYMGSEEFIRLQFEEYLLALLSAAKYHFYLHSQSSATQQKPVAVLSDIEGDPATDFNLDWLAAWTRTDNFRIFQKFTDSHLFDIVEPRHPCAGGLTIEDVQRRLTQQIVELHLDERFSTGKEALNKHLATGQKKVSSAFNNLWADIEALREAQRQKSQEEQLRRSTSPGTSGAQSNPSGASPQLHRSLTSSSWEKRSSSARGPTDLSSHAQAVGQKAGAYISSWGTWASERRKGWARSSTSPSNATSKASDQEHNSPSAAPSSGLTRLKSLTEKRAAGRRSKEESRQAAVETRARANGKNNADGIGRLDA